ncbi:hypothetical protein M501DRAFT_1013566 [Patellaria atrata CBS 101060]|uniref:Uncharacterized protein n=1 Tax=Patellaria atrata CBS 101060 TaxID=1346257 RepID=A0A9P4SG01_9PEZI|nr:hypothetical protein M501DRAFT_1013566 [Patellaria atrata CBS 101060]
MTSPGPKISSEAKKRMNFLHTSAQFLAFSSPATAAFLGSQCDQYIETNNITLRDDEHEARRRDTCGACGNIIVSGVSSSIHKRTISGHRLKDNMSSKSPNLQGHLGTKATNVLTYQCPRCNRNYRQVYQSMVPKATKTSLPTTRVQMEDAPGRVQSITEDRLGSSNSDISTATTANANSKKRAKARKQGGLQAMLAKSKSDASNSGGSSGFGLGFMDFMKK